MVNACGRKKQAVAGIDSLNSIQWNPRILCNTSKKTWEPGEPEEPGKQHVGKCSDKCVGLLLVMSRACR